MFAVNRRLDEWIEVDRFDLCNKIEAPPVSQEPSIAVTDFIDGTDRKITRNQKRKHDEINHVQKVSQWKKMGDCFIVLLICIFPKKAES